MIYETTNLKASDEEILLKIGETVYTPADIDSEITVWHHLDDDADLEDDFNLKHFININRIYGSINIGNKEDGFHLHLYIDTLKTKWKIINSPVNIISGKIFPHQIEIDLGKSEIYVRFDILS
jgi:hypothetical protein